MRTPAVALVLLASLAGGAGRPQDGPTEPKPYHLRLYVYTTPDVRPRHRAIVEKAILRRAHTHTSGFAAQGDAPVLALGPVTRNVRHWRWRGEDDDWHVSTVATRAWPFVAVLEFTPGGDPKAWIDWFRRARHSRDGGAWVKDPADQRYARFISDQAVCDRDERYAYMALVDTPTGDVIPDNEWVVRARVEWEDGSVQERTGWWLRFRDTERRDTDEWWAELTPLVDWLPRPLPGRRTEHAGSETVDDPEDDLAVFGTTTVFTLPAIPPDVTPCGG